MRIGKTDTFGSQVVQIRGRDFGAGILAIQVAIAHVVGIQNHNVGFDLLFFGSVCHCYNQETRYACTGYVTIFFAVM